MWCGLLPVALGLLWNLLTLRNAQKLPVSGYIDPGTVAVSSKWNHSRHRDFIKKHQCQQCCQHLSEGVLLSWALNDCHNFSPFQCMYCYSAINWSLLLCFMYSLSCKWLSKAMERQASLEEWKASKLNIQFSTQAVRKLSSVFFLWKRIMTPPQREHAHSFLPWNSWQTPSLSPAPLTRKILSQILPWLIGKTDIWLHKMNRNYADFLMNSEMSHFRSIKPSINFPSCVSEIVFGIIILMCVLIITCLVQPGGRQCLADIPAVSLWSWKEQWSTCHPEFL